MRTKRTWWPIRGSYKLILSVTGCAVLLAILPDISGQEFKPELKTDYRSVFGDKYLEAEQYLAGKRWISDSLKAYAICPVFAQALIFPELIRYSGIRDKIETQGLYALYLQYGPGYADFSIGRFQMKPSFAERVERDAIQRGGLTARLLHGVDTAPTPGARLARVNRLESQEWQVKYLICFIKLMDLKYNKFSEEDKVRFYAAAYNSGYWLDEEVIRKTMSRNYFHTSLIGSEPCYNYGDIVVAYYRSNRSQTAGVD